MSLLDDANRKVAEVYPPPFTRPYGVTKLFMEALTVDGPVVLLPDDQGVKVAKLTEVIDRLTTSEKGYFDVAMTVAQEVAS